MPVDVAIALVFFGFSTAAFVYLVKQKGGIQKMLHDLEASQTRNPNRTRKYIRKNR